MPRNAMEVLRERDPAYAGQLDRIDRFGYSQGVERAKGPNDGGGDGAYSEPSLSLTQRLSLEQARAAKALKLQAARDDTQAEEAAEHAAAFRALVQTAGDPLLHLFRATPTRRLRAACAYALSRVITDEQAAGCDNAPDASGCPHACSLRCRRTQVLFVQGHSGALQTPHAAGAQAVRLAAAAAWQSRWRAQQWPERAP